MNISTASECWYKDICKNDCNTCTKYAVIKSLMRMSGIPEILHHPIMLTCGQQDKKQFTRLQEIKEDVDGFVEDGDNLFICSQYTGNGKTSWAIKIMYKLFELEWDIWGPVEPLGLFIYVPEFLTGLKNFNNPFSNNYLEDIKKAPLVIWDDIGAGKISEYDYTQLLIYINSRQQANKANIFTSNYVSPEDLSSQIGSRLASRIFNTSEIIVLKGKDMR